MARDSGKRMARELGEDTTNCKRMVRGLGKRMARELGENTTNCKRMTRYLGEDLESEILMRTSSKSLMRFKCVQKSWNTLLSNHRFVMSHMNMHMSKEHLMVFQVYRNSPQKRDINWNIHASLTRDDLSQPPQYLKSYSPNKVKFCRSYGSCNGVFCVGGYYKHYYLLILWNPNTGDVKFFSSNKFSDDFQGFGVDPNTNDFKIIKPTINIDDLHHPIISFAEIYNVRTNSWTVIHDVTLPLLNNFEKRSGIRSYVLVNCVYHWFIGHEDGFGYILCFDFCKNQFSKLMAPVDLSDRKSLCIKDNIVEVNGSIGYIVQYHRQERLEIWVINEHKWTKTHSIVWPSGIYIFGFWKDANQLLGGKGDQDKYWLTIYNLDAQPVHQFPFEVFYFSRIDKYVESIVPVPAQLN